MVAVQTLFFVEEKVVVDSRWPQILGSLFSSRDGGLCVLPTNLGVNS